MQVPNIHPDALTQPSATPAGADLESPLVAEQDQHVNRGDKPAEEPDRRDQPGQAFDDGINARTAGNDIPQSAEINELNRYANPENAQSRTLNPDGSKPNTGSE